MKKEEVDSIIDSLADKTLSFGCEITVMDNNEKVSKAKVRYYEETESCGQYTELIGGDIIDKDNPNLAIWEILGHEIKIGDILEKIIKNGLWNTADKKNIFKILNLWGICGLSSSLQQIIAESGHEEIEHYRGEQEPLMEQVLKSPAKELLKFIKDLKLK